MALRLSGPKKWGFEMTLSVSKTFSLKDYFVSAFGVHESLWSCYNKKLNSPQLDYCGGTYDVYRKDDFCCTVLPNYLNDNENNFWMTNNMLRSTLGTFQINDAKSRNEVLKTTWIIGRISANEHYMKGHISTTHDISGDLKYATVHCFYYGSSIELYRYINRGDNNFINSSCVNKNIKVDYLIF